MSMFDIFVIKFLEFQTKYFSRVINALSGISIIYFTIWMVTIGRREGTTECKNEDCSRTMGR